MRFHAALLLLIVPELSSCTTLATGIATAPPGIHSASFRECLLDNGFFTPTVLTGVAASDYRIKHQGKEDRYPARTAIMAMPDAQFIALTSRAIQRGLLPHLQYGQPDTVADRSGTQRPALLDRARGRPYAQNIAGEPYPDGGYAKSDIPGFGSDLDRPEMAINRYLDCYLGPVGHEAPTDETIAGLLAANDGDNDLEGRLLRAHILLTLAASYGAELLASRPAPNQTNYAERLLEHVAAAEKAIRISSPVMNPAIRAGLPGGRAGKAALSADGSRITLFWEPPLTDQASLRWTDNATRILRVFQVAVDIETIDGRQSLDRATNILAAFTNPTGALFGSVLEDALKGFGTVQKIRLYGDAMLRDARETLTAHRQGLGADGAGTGDFTYALPPKLERGSAEYLWRLWDRPLAKACESIAHAAKTERECIPTDQMLQDWSKDLGPRVPGA